MAFHRFSGLIACKQTACNNFSVSADAGQKRKKRPGIFADPRPVSSA
jgi:hypothetical protein